MQAQADERPHAPWMGGTAIEGHFIIDLEMSGHPQALPNRPECCIDGVAATAEQGLCSTPAGGQVHDIHAVEAHWFCLPFEVTQVPRNRPGAGHSRLPAIADRACLWPYNGPYAAGSGHADAESD